MNHRGGWALIKRSWASWLQYRSFFFVLAFGWMIPPLIYLFVWSTASEPAPIAGMTPEQFVAYYLVLILVNQLTFAQTNWTVGDVIRMGSLNSWLLRPMSPLYNTIASEVAGKIVMMAFVVPVSIVLAIVLRPELNATATQAVLFFVALTGAWLLRFFWGLWLACLAFWATRADALLALQDAMIFLLAGVVAPVAVLPPLLQIIAHVLPFYYMVGFPVEVLTGQITGVEVTTGFMIQAAWLLVAVLIYRFVWRSGLKRYSAIGG
jgi:ABC-2 type transport system permease protein